jgi:hypothetical protein
MDSGRNATGEESKAGSSVTKQPSLGLTVWAFLNSAVGLWFLGTVAVGGGVWLFQQWRDQVQSDLTTQARFDHINLELSFRLSQFYASVLTGSGWLRPGCHGPEDAIILLALDPKFSQDKGCVPLLQHVSRIRP